MKVARMYRTLGLVEVFSSDPTARDVCPPQSRRVGAHSAIEWLVRRASEALHIDQVVIATNRAQDIPFLAGSVPSDVPVVHCERGDALACTSKVLDDFDGNAIVRIRMENPLVDPVFIDQMITSAQSTSNCDYAAYAHSGGRALASHIGVFADWFRGTALRRAAQLATDDSDRENIATYITKHPEAFNLRFLAVPTPLDREDVRLTVSTEDDWDHFHVIYDALGPDGMDWRRISGLLDANPEMRRRMAELNSHEGAN